MPSILPWFQYKKCPAETLSPANATRILEAFAQIQPPESADNDPPLVEALSERELQDPRLMVGGLKFKEIADQLFISLNTVRYHVKALYGKLGVNINNRAQAIEKARRQQLILLSYKPAAQFRSAPSPKILLD